MYFKSVLYNDYIIVQFHGILSFQFLTGDCVGLTILTMKVNYDLFAFFFVFLRYAEYTLDILNNKALNKLFRYLKTLQKKPRNSKLH